MATAPATRPLPSLSGHLYGNLSRSLWGQRLLEFTFAIGTLRERARLQELLDQVAAATLRTLLGERLAPGDKLAVGIAIASVESFAALGAALDDLTEVGRDLIPLPR